MALPSTATTATINLCQPPGSVVSYMGMASTLAGLERQGWLECDGASVSSFDYPALYAAIGTTYGGDGNPDFQLPNLAGMFLRGVDPGGGQDPDAASRTCPVPGDGRVAGPTVGSRQACQVQDHQHQWGQNFESISWAGNDINVQLSLDSPNGGNAGTQPTTNVDGGGAETRPGNVYVYFLIFAGLPQAIDR
ncbi:MAG TPA: phage tail protein [Allosphingosinicella sp.]|nr:phage tail protein [Allosphingosinicella sp.]